MLRSKYIVGADIPPFDNAITDALDSYAIEGGGKVMLIGVENSAGIIYRVITTVGLGAFMHAISVLVELGLKDILADSETGKNGYDSWFVVTSETAS